jgi:ABC-2 type transport system ATP-binding protein
MEEADQLCGAISIIDHGKFVASGSPAELKSRVTADIVEVDTSQTLSIDTLRALPGVTDVRTQGSTWILRTTSSEQLLPNLFPVLRTELIRRINVERPSLESVFIELTGHRLDQAGAEVRDYRKFYATMRRARQ